MLMFVEIQPQIANSEILNWQPQALSVWLISQDYNFKVRDRNLVDKLIR